MNHELYMQTALDLAKKGWPDVAPNPMVGCVIVKGNEIVATGYHRKYGDAHAEVNAINNMPPDIDPAGCIMYVTLEPCRHHGKTPPCADLIISKGFQSVVVACKDPNPLVSGSGIRKLLEAGLDVITGILEQEARELNKRFITFFEKKRPYIILKWAISADGFISRSPVPSNRNDNWISRKEAQELVHRIRSESSAVLVGKNTVLNDDPMLTTRFVKGRNPTRVFIDRNLEVPKNFNIYNSEATTIVFNTIKEGHDGNITFAKINFNENIVEQVIHKLYQLNFQSVLVEGGAILLNDFIEQKLWDEALVFQNPDLYFHQGVKAPVFPLKNTFELVGEDKLYRHSKYETFVPSAELYKYPAF
jgi:diaminohydroxyphosphoribosylaminopyrimidine deaminase / 5-amino-6-(5-phosphoribosylamino)uracil reductase